MSKQVRHLGGFTIVELLIVVVIIAILAAVTVVAYNGVRDRANDSKIRSDIAQLKKAILMARASSGDIALRYITLSTHTGQVCWNKAAGTDLAALDQATDGCWTAYTASLDRISTASSVNVRGLKDPWGRPYYIDENEAETVYCNKDAIGYYSQPFTTGQTMTKLEDIPYVISSCS